MREKKKKWELINETFWKIYLAKLTYNVSINYVSTIFVFCSGISSQDLVIAVSWSNITSKHNIDMSSTNLVC